MTEGGLTPDRILDAAEQALARYGPQKTTVVDVARVLGVSHGSVYRHFASKAALRDAVTERWLARVDGPLARIVSEKGPASERLHRWFLKLIAIKRQKALSEPELFATYTAILADAGDVIRDHIAALTRQVSAIIADGISRGEFADMDPDATGRALFYATIRFHAPAFASEWAKPGIDDVFEDLWRVLERGLLAAPASSAGSGGRRRRGAPRAQG